MAENPVSTRPPLARKPHRYKVDEGLDVRFLCHANSTHVLQTLWRGLAAHTSKGLAKAFVSSAGGKGPENRDTPAPLSSTLRGARLPSNEQRHLVQSDKGLQPTAPGYSGMSRPRRAL